MWSGYLQLAEHFNMPPPPKKNQNFVNVEIFYIFVPLVKYNEPVSSSTDYYYYKVV